VEHVRQRVGFDTAVAASTNTHLANEARAAFASLLTAIYVDVPPRHRFALEPNLHFPASRIPPASAVSLRVAMSSAVPSARESKAKRDEEDRKKEELDRPDHPSGAVAQGAHMLKRTLSMTRHGANAAVDVAKSAADTVATAAHDLADAAHGLFQEKAEVDWGKLHGDFAPFMTSTYDNGGPMLLPGEAAHCTPVTQGSMRLLVKLVDFGFFFSASSDLQVPNYLPTDRLTD
jgi:hypothetical protein